METKKDHSIRLRIERRLDDQRQEYAEQYARIRAPVNLLTFFSRRKVTAEELYVESLASDNDQWLFFQIEKIPASLQMEQLRMWLATNRPSQARSRFKAMHGHN